MKKLIRKLAKKKRRQPKITDNTITNSRAIVEIMVGLMIGIMIIAQIGSIIKKRYETINKDLIRTSEDVIKTIKTIKTIKEKNDYHDNYSEGVRAVEYMFRLREDIDTLYKSKDITFEQAKQYKYSYLKIIQLILSDNMILDEDINNYNTIIKEMPLINYDTYCIKSKGENYKKGFCDATMIYVYRQVLAYHYKKIPENYIKGFNVVLKQNFSYFDAEKEKCEKIINYGEHLVSEYIGLPSEILKSDEWRTSSK